MKKVQSIDIKIHYSTVQLKLVVKTKIPFISPTCFLFPILGNSVSPFGETQFTNLPPFSPEFSSNFPRIPLKFINFPRISPEFPRNSLIFPEFPPNFPMIPTDSSWFLGSFLCSFHFTSVAYSFFEHQIYFMNIAFRLSLKMRIQQYVSQWILGKFRGILANSGDIPGNSGEFWQILGEFWQILGEFWRI